MKTQAYWAEAEGNSPMEILNVLNTNGVRVEAFGVRRFWPRIAITPLRVLHSLITERRLRGGDLWDLFGFAEYVLGRRPVPAGNAAGPSPEGSDP